ncbi:MAG TPA: extracellular solute-binding protein [Actinomycetota bacterium]|jgi:multiple sugar transport system substrate-binding protein|nr:extracellular solute-binding protein [Actinomycetota bacterium]
MRRRVVAIVAFALLVAACTAGGGGDSTPETIDPSVSHEPVTLAMWSQWTSAAEKKVFNAIFDGFEAKYPWITVDSTTGLTDQKFLAAINAGDAPDALLSFGVDNVGKFCESGAWIDMNPYIEGPDGIDMAATFPPTALTYTSYNGVQCALPFLTDVTGMYYNTDMLDKAGISEPPATTDDLLEAAKKLTEFDNDGSIKVAGFVPWIGYNCCGNTTLSFGHMFGATWLDDQGAPAFASDPAWAEMFQWQHDFITEVYGDGDFQTGADRLQRFVAGSADEFSSANDFQIGRVAITLDGEWRAGPNFIQAEAPDLNYDTAPLPTSPDDTDLYGSGIAGGTVIGIPRGSEHEAEAWLLIKYMATDTATIVYMANNAYNVPTTNEALASPDLEFVPQFQTFMDAFAHPASEYRPTTPIGDALAVNAIDVFSAEWQVGKSTDLLAGLQEATELAQTALDQASV